MLTLFHDYTSPASAVAVARLQRLADDGLTVEFEGFEAFGVDVAVAVPVDVLAAVDQLRAEARSEGVVLRRPADLPPTAPAHVVGQLATDAGAGPAWRTACYRAFWADGADIADPAVLTDLAAGAGLDAVTVAAALTDRGRVAAVRRRTAAHRREGVGGVPTLLAMRTLAPGLLDEEELRAIAAVA